MSLKSFQTEWFKRLMKIFRFLVMGKCWLYIDFEYEETSQQMSLATIDDGFVPTICEAFNYE